MANEYTSIEGQRLGLGSTGEIVVDGTRLDVTTVPSNSGAADTVQIAAITTAGGTAIEAGTLQEVLQAIADLADPAA